VGSSKESVLFSKSSLSTSSISIIIMSLYYVKYIRVFLLKINSEQLPAENSWQIRNIKYLLIVQLIEDFKDNMSPTNIPLILFVLQIAFNHFHQVNNNDTSESFHWHSKRIKRSPKGHGTTAFF
jgi:hypothetical protein